MKSNNSAVTMAVVGICALAVAGCTAIRRDNTLQTERTLAAAGFQMKFADDATKLQDVQGVDPQRTLLPRSQDGETRFVYADAEFCKCMYVGTEDAYQRYQKLAITQQISNAQLATAQANEAASMNWGAWGGWGPWW